MGTAISLAGDASRASNGRAASVECVSRVSPLLPEKPNNMNGYVSQRAQSAAPRPLMNFATERISSSAPNSAISRHSKESCSINGLSGSIVSNGSFSGLESGQEVRTSPEKFSSLIRQANTSVGLLTVSPINPSLSPEDMVTIEGTNISIKDSQGLLGKKSSDLTLYQADLPDITSPSLVVNKDVNSGSFSIPPVSSPIRNNTENDASPVAPFLTELNISNFPKRKNDSNSLLSSAFPRYFSVPCRTCPSWLDDDNSDSITPQSGLNSRERGISDGNGGGNGDRSKVFSRMVSLRLPNITSGLVEDETNNKQSPFLTPQAPPTRRSEWNHSRVIRSPQAGDLRTSVISTRGKRVQRLGKRKGLNVLSASDGAIHSPYLMREVLIQPKGNDSVLQDSLTPENCLSPLGDEKQTMSLATIQIAQPDGEEDVKRENDSFSSALRRSRARIVSFDKVAIFSDVEQEEYKEEEQQQQQQQQGQGQRQEEIRATEEEEPHMVDETMKEEEVEEIRSKNFITSSFELCKFIPLPGSSSSNRTGVASPTFENPTSQISTVLSQSDVMETSCHYTASPLTSSPRHLIVPLVERPQRENLAHRRTFRPRPVLMGTQSFLKKP
ncbi:uncharacterized protein TM35_000212060 [Trypanosoma theileri]|uniref:Uncharacterized protein n=1 Tax=Trypanosoma theileri TaxID=67003 RepID=A0A1X0NU23_9TRYP|nr:uncharacterized protein TM35_000212060 [Trypanosoma theileri]ORC87600.1 hypothetical protein TM35_000212060 [Trypanosoma theileri]